MNTQQIHTTLTDVIDPEAPLRQRQQHDAAVRGEAPAVEGGCDFLPSDGWKAEARDRIVDHGGRGSM